MDCTLNVSGVMTCKSSPDDCAAEVKSANLLTAQSKRVYQTAYRVYGQWAVLLIIPGIIFTLFGLWSARGDMQAVGLALLPMGLFLMLASIYLFLARRNYPQG